mgnify:CR=1 FL=1
MPYNYPYDETDRTGNFTGTRATALPVPRPGSDTYAQDMNAYIARQQWEDYQRRFQPVERQLIDETMGRELLDKRLSSISAITDTSFDSALRNARMTREMYGAGQTNQQRQYEDRRMDLGRSTAIADARNSTRTRIHDRNMDTLAGGSSAVNQAIRG